MRVAVLSALDQEKGHDVTCQRSTTRMMLSSTHGCGAMDVGWLASGLVTCRQPQMRDGDESKLRHKGIRKAVLNVIDVIAHNSAGYGRLGTGRNRQDDGRDP